MCVTWEGKENMMALSSNISWTGCKKTLHLFLMKNWLCFVFTSLYTARQKIKKTCTSCLKDGTCTLCRGTHITTSTHCVMEFMNIITVLFAAPGGRAQFARTVRHAVTV